MAQFGELPRSRENNLIDYAKEVQELRALPGEWALLVELPSKEAAKVTRTLKGFGGLEIATRASGEKGVDDRRAVWARAIEVFSGEASV